jgi:hypothetical protein
MNSTIPSILGGTVMILMAGCASTFQAPSTPPSATLSLEAMSAAYSGAVVTGKGTLNYQGRVHHFTMTGLGIGGTGLQKVSATGEVYNLNNLADFAGTYKGVSKGLTLFKGRMQSKVTNEHGVVAYVAAETNGIASDTGARAFEVKLTD